jgi:hypothetical protein
MRRARWFYNDLGYEQPLRLQRGLWPEYEAVRGDFDG